MNLVEVYLEEVHKVTPSHEEWCDEFPNLKFVKVEATWGSYGRSFKREDIYNSEIWEEIKKVGYYLG